MAQPTSYYRPETIEEAVQLLAQPHMRARLLSGGALQLADDIAEVVIDVQAIPGLSAIAEEKDGLRIGAAATLDVVANDDRVPALLRQTIKRIVPWNRRNAISLAEAIEHAADLAEITAALLALGAATIFATPDELVLPLADLNSDVHQPKLPERGLMVAVDLPVGIWQSWGTAQVARTPADQAIVSASICIAANETGCITDAILAMTGGGQDAARIVPGIAGVLQGCDTLSESLVTQVLTAVDAALDPVDDYLGSAAYRRAMAAVLVRRALQDAMNRLRG